MRFASEVSRGALRRSLLSLAAGVALVGAYLTGVARADGIPGTDPLYYAGVLEDGGALVEGTRDVVVELYDAPTGGTAQCHTDALSTSFASGRFRVALHADCVAAVQASPDLWAQVSIGATTLPRTKLGAVPYAVEAQRAALADDADTLDGLDASAFSAAAHAHGASDVTAGTLPVQRGGTGISSVAGNSNELLGVNFAGTGYETKSLQGASGQISVTHGAADVTLGLAAGVPRSCTYHEASAALSSSVVCPVGKKVTGGGSACAPSNDQGTAGENRLKYSRPSPDRTTWSTVCTHATNGAYSYAICCAE